MAAGAWNNQGGKSASSPFNPGPVAGGACIHSDYINKQPRAWLAQQWACSSSQRDHLYGSVGKGEEGGREFRPCPLSECYWLLQPRPWGKRGTTEFGADTTLVSLGLTLVSLGLTRH